VYNIGIVDAINTRCTSAFGGRWAVVCSHDTRFETAGDVGDIINQNIAISVN
jgi:hypothetical protein